MLGRDSGSCDLADLGSDSDPVSPFLPALGPAPDPAGGRTLPLELGATGVGETVDLFSLLRLGRYQPLVLELLQRRASQG